MEEPPTGTGDLTYALVKDFGNTHGRLLIQNDEYQSLLNLVNNAGSFQEIYKSQCRFREIFEPDPDNLNYLVRPNVKCEFKKRLTISKYYSLELVCNTLIEKTDPKFKKKRPKNYQGSAKSSRGSRTGGRTNAGSNSGSGPSAFFSTNDLMYDSRLYAPLNEEDKDLSQFSLEYDRWGNLIGFNFQLNKEGTGLADPDSIETPIDSRWSWNAVASPQKGLLNKLIIKSND